MKSKSLAERNMNNFGFLFARSIRDATQVRETKFFVIYRNPVYHYFTATHQKQT